MPLVDPVVAPIMAGWRWADQSLYPYASSGKMILTKAPSEAGGGKATKVLFLSMPLAYRSEGERRLGVESFSFSHRKP